jgi:AcrR family transcriptional regulator
MPKVVDHDTRRLELANAAARIVAEKGLENATVRDIAREAGFSSGILSHYFRDKDDVLAQTLRLLDERTAALFAPSHTDAATVEAVLEEGMSLDKGRDLDARIRIHFWARALTNPELAAQQAGSFKAWIRATRALLRSRQKRGELEPDLKLDPIAEVLAVLGVGIGVMAVFLPKRSRRAFVHRVVDTATRALF